MYLDSDVSHYLYFNFSATTQIIAWTVCNVYYTSMYGFYYCQMFLRNWKHSKQGKGVPWISQPAVPWLSLVPVDACRKTCLIASEKYFASLCRCLRRSFRAVPLESAAYFSQHETLLCALSSARVSLARFTGAIWRQLRKIKGTLYWVNMIRRESRDSLFCGKSK